MQIFNPGEACAHDFEQLDSGMLKLQRLLGRTCVGAGADNAEHGPQAFLASFLPSEAGGSIPRRSYPFAQFQVVVNGEATVGRYLVRPGSFHYSDADSISGPITPLDPDIGLTYLALRPDSGSRGAPAAPSTERAPASLRRSIVGSTIQRGSLTETHVSELVGPEDDGLGVCSVTVPAKATYAPACGVSLGGKYLVVLKGSISHAGEDLTTGSLVYLRPDETADFTADTNGSELLLLQFPSMEYAP